MRGRILQELDALGVRGRTATQISCVNEGRYGVLSCGSVTNIVTQVTDGPGKQIVLMAHADSVAAGPGAGDDVDHGRRRA